MKIYASVILVTVFLLAAPGIHASYMANCVLKVKVKSVGPVEALAGKPGRFERRATFIISSVRSQGGHSNRHCEKYPGRTFEKPITGNNKDELKQVSNGDKAIIHFETVTSELVDENGKMGLVTDTVWEYRGWSFWDNFY